MYVLNNNFIGFLDDNVFDELQNKYKIIKKDYD